MHILSRINRFRFRCQGGALALAAAIGLVACAALTGCSPKIPSPVPKTIITVTAYPVHATITTVGGVTIDSSGVTLPTAYLEKVDRITGEAFSCVGQPRKPVTLKIPSDWTLNCDKTQQVLPVVAGTGDPNKPPGTCGTLAYWRAFVQRDGSIVSTPSLYLYKDPLVRMLTGVQGIWSDSALARCATPTSTGPLDTLE